MIRQIFGLGVDTELKSTIEPPSTLKYLSGEDEDMIKQALN